MQVEVREQRARYGGFEWPDLEPMFAERLAAEDLTDATVLDLGTGQGRLALLLAPRAKIVVGIDTDEEALAAARGHARGFGIANATFVPGDADTANYRQIVRSPIDYVVASHFLSAAAIHATAKALRPRGRFLFVGHHADQWIETGRVGRFSFGEAAMNDLLTAAGFEVEFLGLEKTIVSYDSLAALAAAHPELREKFREDGRWAALEAHFGGGSAELTWAALVGVAGKA